MFESFMNWASGQLGLQDQWDKTGFDDAWGGGNWRNRVKGVGLPTAGQLPQLPMPGEKNILSVAGDIAVNKILMPAFATEGSGFHRLATNISEVGKQLYETVEYPQRTLDHWGREATYFYQGGRPSGDDEDTDTGASSSTGGGGSNGGGDGVTKASREEERARMDAIRRMLAGRYGRAETNLTGGSGYGEGKSRGLGGY